MSDFFHVPHIGVGGSYIYFPVISSRYGCYLDNVCGWVKTYPNKVSNGRVHRYG